MVTISDVSPTISVGNEKSSKWMLNSCCSKHMSNNRAQFSNFVECKEAGQVGNNDVIPLYGVGTARMETVVDGVKNYITLNGVRNTPKIMNLYPNLSSTHESFQGSD